MSKIFLCIFITIIAIIYIFNRNIIFPFGYYPKVIALGFPLFFDIKNKGLRNIGMGICLGTMYSINIIPLMGVYTAFLFKFHKHKVSIFFITYILILASLALTPFTKTPQREIESRTSIYSDAGDKWQHKFKGNGFLSYYKLKVTRIANNQERHIARMHSDFLQILFEFGVIKGGFIVLVILLPIIWIKWDMISACYISFLIQFFIDFPLYRCSAGYGYVSLIMSIIIWIMMWNNSPYGQRNNKTDSV